jgi:hypothetical protein
MLVAMGAPASKTYSMNQIEDEFAGHAEQLALARGAPAPMTAKVHQQSVDPRTKVLHL